jgi:hypothetical protein
MTTDRKPHSAFEVALILALAIGWGLIMGAVTIRRVLREVPRSINPRLVTLAREFRGLSLAQAALLLDVSEDALRGLESDTRPRVRTSARFNARLRYAFDFPLPFFEQDDFDLFVPLCPRARAAFGFTP